MDQHIGAGIRIKMNIKRGKAIMHRLLAGATAVNNKDAFVSAAQTLCECGKSWRCDHGNMADAGMSGKNIK